MIDTGLQSAVAELLPEEEPRFARIETPSVSEVLTKASLSAEATRHRDWFRLPVRMLSAPRRGVRSALCEHTLKVNELISGKIVDRGLWSFVDRHLPAEVLERLEPELKLEFHPIWSTEELEDMNGKTLEETWIRRANDSPRCSEAARTIRWGQDFSSIWKSLPGGDFDLNGRGRDYTVGMEYFQAARAFGAESLLRLFEDPKKRSGGLVLDVLGGDGYVMRLLEASRMLEEKRMLIVPVAHHLEVDGDIEVPIVQTLLRSIREKTRGVLVLVVGGAEGLEYPQPGHGPRSCRLLGIGDAGVQLTERIEASDQELLDLLAQGSAAWLDEGPSATGLPAVLRAVNRHLAQANRRRPEVVTNDLSPHMFRSAGLWGFAAREDAQHLSRTFKTESFDGVLYAYGTHHIDHLERAIRDTYAIVKPGGKVVIHDFLDEGQVGKWFHDVVHRHSRTGHDFSHLSPVQMAVYLFLGGFREIELYEMEDPFVFAVPEGSDRDVREVACTYLLGMYGMGDSFAGDLDRFEEVVRDTLTYEEIGNVPLFADDFVYIPRRAVVASGRRPAGGVPARLSASDAALCDRIAWMLSTEPREIVECFNIPPEISSLWFTRDGKRWGLTEEVQDQWFDWLATPPAS